MAFLIATFIIGQQMSHILTKLLWKKKAKGTTGVCPLPPLRRWCGAPHFYGALGVATM